MANPLECKRFLDATPKWREHLYPGHDHSRDQKPDLIEGSIANKGIGEILFDRQDKWDEWKQSFVEFHSGLNGRGKSQAELLELLASIEQQKPFYVTGKTILNHLQTLESLGYLEFVDVHLSKSKFKLVDKFPSTPVDSPVLQLSEVVKIEDSECLSEDFSSYTHLFSQRVKDVQRFYIHADYRTLDTEKLEITSLHQKVLKEIWEREIIPLVKLKYHSASQNRSYTAIVSPVCIYYHQRAFYLCGFGVCGAETQSSWHNYRIDRIEKIEELENSRDDLPQDLQVQGERANQQKLIEEIENRLTDAYGFDFYRAKQTMLLRFDRDFHDRYIANTWRHNSFKEITPSKKEIDRLIKGSNLANNELLKKRIAAHPNDAYYTMNYRKGDNRSEERRVGKEC